MWSHLRQARSYGERLNLCKQALDCRRHCCQGHSQLPTRDDGPGISAQYADTTGRSWTTCPELRIRRPGTMLTATSQPASMRLPSRPSQSAPSLCGSPPCSWRCGRRRSSRRRKGDLCPARRAARSASAWAANLLIRACQSPLSRGPPLPRDIFLPPKSGARVVQRAGRMIQASQVAIPHATPPAP